jgi:hypothetical protein
MAELQMIDKIDYRLAFILPRSRQLVGIDKPGAVEFPVVGVSLRERPAEQLTREIEKRWKIKTIILDMLGGSDSTTPCAVTEVRTASWDFELEGFCIAQPEKVSESALAGSQSRSLKSILSDDDATCGAFSRIGWIEDAQRWIQSSVSDHEVIFTGDIRQLNGGGAFCLLRLGTHTGPAYWIKGVGEPNTHEFAITSFLARHCPEYLPPIAATRTDWNAWVMEDFGTSLHSSNSLSDFEGAAIRLAELQKLLAGRSEELLAAHFWDHRTKTLRSHIEELIEYLDDAMRLQTSTNVPKLTESRLHKIGAYLYDCCDAMAGLDIPDSVMHSDISPGSILSNGTDCVFTDWCEGYVGNPFITLEQLCVHAARKTNEADSWTRRLKHAYRSCWASVLTEQQIDKALKLAPALSLLSYLYGRGDWLHTPRRNDPMVQSYCRSLARHMDRIVGSSDPSEALCRPS